MSNYRSIAAFLITTLTAVFFLYKFLFASYGGSEFVYPLADFLVSAAVPVAIVLSILIIIFLINNYALWKALAASVFCVIAILWIRSIKANHPMYIAFFLSLALGALLAAVLTEVLSNVDRFIGLTITFGLFSCSSLMVLTLYQSITETSVDLSKGLTPWAILVIWNFIAYESFVPNLTEDTTTKATIIPMSILALLILILDFCILLGDYDLNRYLFFLKTFGLPGVAAIMIFDRFALESFTKEPLFSD